MGGPVRLVIPADALPVMGEPFLWAFEIRDLELGAGDICPTGVDPDEPLGDPSLMARFPENDWRSAPAPGGRDRGAGPVGPGRSANRPDGPS